MNILIKPQSLSGEVTAPPSKSFTHRALIIAALAKGKSIIKNILWSDDTKITFDALQKLGVKISKKGSDVIVEGTAGIFPKSKIPINIYLGNSGTSLRLLTGVAAICGNTINFDGSKRLRERPMKDLIEALTSMGVNVKHDNFHLSMTILGEKLKGGKIEISGSISSQFISSLLIVSPFALKDTTINITGNIKSFPYILITVDVMKKFGVYVEKINESTFKVYANNSYTRQNYDVEGDYSSASYFLAIGAILGKKITVKNLNPNSFQADKIFLDILKKMGGKIEIKDNGISVHGDTLKGIEVDMKNCPDIVQTISIVAAVSKGKTVINNISHLKHKETNRINSTVVELRKMGIKTETDQNNITIYGGIPLGAAIDTYNDHRMAMSFSILGLKAKGFTIIKNAEVVSKSYPDFYKTLESLGCKLSYKKSG